MRVARVVAGLTAAITAAVGLNLATAGPAAAADAGTWVPYGNTNPITSSASTWSCARTLSIASDVGAQVCAIRSPSGTGVQGAVIVRNNRSTLFVTDASVDVGTGLAILGLWYCPLSGVGAHSWSVCFGRTLSYSSWVRSRGSADLVSLGTSPFV